MKPVDIKSNTYIGYSKDINEKDPNFKTEDIVGVSTHKAILQKFTFQISLKKFLLLKKLNILCRGHMLLMVLVQKKLLDFLTKADCRKQVKKRLELKK